MHLYAAILRSDHRGHSVAYPQSQNFEFYTAPEELPRGVRTSTAILNVGVVTYIVVTVIITSINLMMQ